MKLKKKRIFGLIRKKVAISIERVALDVFKTKEEYRERYEEVEKLIFFT